MEKKRYSNWWFLALNGIIAILFGLLLLFFTKEAIEKMVFVFGLIILLSGIAMLVTGIINLKMAKKAGLLLFESVVTIAIGTIIMFFPQHSLQFFLIIIGVWAIILGIVQLIILINSKVEVSGKNLFLFNGLITLGIGIVLLFYSDAFADVLVKLIGVFSILFGCILIYLSFVLHRIKVTSQQP
jgi:uncharacterized membrane protein HdeD (DUF308 family)